MIGSIPEEQLARSQALSSRIREVQAIFQSWSPLEQAIHRLQQKRSFVHGMMPSSSPLSDKQIDALVDKRDEFIILQGLLDARAALKKVPSLNDVISAASWAIHDVPWPTEPRNLERRQLAANAVVEAITELFTRGSDHP